MVTPMILAMLASASAPSAGAAPPARAAVARASGQAVVRLLTGRAVPMSADSSIEADQRRTIVRLADGEREAFLVEFQ